jgi:hypothetical protein
MEGLLERRYALVAGAPRSGWTLHPGVVPGRDVDPVLRLSPGGRVRLHMVDAAGAPVEGATLRVERFEGLSFSTGLWRDLSSRDGSAEIEVPAGRLELVAEHPDGRLGTLRVEVAARGAVTGELVLELPEAPEAR